MLLNIVVGNSDTFLFRILWLIEKYGIYLKSKWLHYKKSIKILLTLNVWTVIYFKAK